MIILFGPAGAGKSVQGKMMAARHNWKWLSTGEMLRASDDPAIKAIMKRGELVSDEQTYQVFTEAIKDAEDRGYEQIIIDGFPRSMEQAEWLEGFNIEHGQTIDVVVVLEVPDSEIMKRLAMRGRDEDQPDVIENRMNIYRKKMYPVLGVFAEKDIRIVHLPGTGTVGEVHDVFEFDLEERGVAKDASGK